MAAPTDKQKQAALKQGDAIKNSRGSASFPIRNKADLANAIRAVGRVRPNTEDARAKVRRFIISRAKALGASNMIPASWQADGSLK